MDVTTMIMLSGCNTVSGPSEASGQDSSNSSLSMRNQLFSSQSELNYQLPTLKPFCEALMWFLFFLSNLVQTNNNHIVFNSRKSSILGQFLLGKKRG